MPRRKKAAAGRASSYVGVYPRDGGKYAAKVFVDGKAHSLGEWAEERAAAIARDRAMLFLGLTDRPLNLPKASKKLGPASPQALRLEARRRSRKGMSSQYFGVVRAPSKRCWMVVVTVGPQQYQTVGRFVDEENAAVAYDRVVRGLHSDEPVLNFPDRDLPPATAEEMGEWARALRSAERRSAKKPAGGHSRYWGVTYVPKTGRYPSYVWFKNERIELGSYDDERAAAIARDRAALYLELDAPLNLPRASRKLGPLSPHELRREARRADKRRKSSQYFGVYWNPLDKRWLAFVCLEGRRQRVIAQFYDERDAAVAHDRVALGMFGEAVDVNFPEQDYEPASITEMRAWAHALFKERTSSQFRGVSWHRQHQAWVAKMEVRREARYLGRFEHEEDAARAYDRAVLGALGRKARPNFHPETGERLMGGVKLEDA